MSKYYKGKVLLALAVIGIALWQAYPINEKISLGLDLQGGMHLVLKVDTRELSDEARKDAPARVLEVIRNRIDQFGVKEPSIQLQGRDKIIIQLPGVTDRERAINIVKQTAHLEFKLVADDNKLISRALAGSVPAGYELKELDEQPLLLEKTAVLTGDTLVTADVSFNQSRFNEPYVSLEFNTKGGRIFSRITGESVGRRLAIVLDGKVQSAPVIQEKIPSGRAQISGRFTVEEANDLATILRAGALPAPVILEEERTVGALLGRDSIDRGIFSLKVGGVCVVAFMIGYYLIWGVVAVIALLLNLVLIMGALAFFGFTLTLPGIAGIVLTVGMAVDANVLIFERIREEITLGRSLVTALKNGYQRAMLTILDSNLTTLITGVVLFYFGTGPVRGFAITLIMGILSSMFSAIFVTRLIFEWMILAGWLKQTMMLQFFKAQKIDFIAKRHIAYVLSLLVIAAGLISFYKRGEANYGVDFSGGTMQQILFEKPMTAEELRVSLSKIGMSKVYIQRIGKEDREFLIRVYSQAGETVLDHIRKDFSHNPFELLRMEEVGPSVGADLRKKALMAVLYSLIGICLYVTIRFQFKYSIAAIVALAHDALVSIAAISLTSREISVTVIAAILTIIGYSINDTIVIFDRVRENLKSLKKSSLAEVMNVSMNQTLSRTFLTSLTTLFVVLALFVLGGAVINDFAFVLLVGIISGTYSTIFVACPLVIDWSGGVVNSKKKR
ncbi:MAG: protein translocase subunit SecD [Candidatus Omnitrophica bacterium]|nr:protein translocase subunit SecD [Candidatus Omnitrophota bacterium]